jgi:Zn-dependent protease
MKSGLHLGHWFGIDVIVHWTFLLLIGLLVVGQLLTGAAWAAVAGSTTLLVAVFLCVLLHEFGHALTARVFGIRTHDITLLPIGGLARLERIPETPWQEFWIALAGPAVNLAIVAVLLPVAAALGGLQNLLPSNLPAASFLMQLISINVALVAFNLLPAFPMDGGCVLRALLAMFLPYSKRRISPQLVANSWPSCSASWAFSRTGCSCSSPSSCTSPPAARRSMSRRDRWSAVPGCGKRWSRGSAPSIQECRCGPLSRSCWRTTSRTFRWSSADR